MVKEADIIKCRLTESIQNSLQGYEEFFDILLRVISGDVLVGRDIDQQREARNSLRFIVFENHLDVMLLVAVYDALKKSMSSDSLVDEEKPEVHNLMNFCNQRFEIHHQKTG